MSQSPALEVAIMDTGRGIAREDLGKVFEPFFSTKRKGSGLGLAIVHQIVENHGGDIAVDSQEGMGTTFRITLPLSGFNS
jgi:signal transduction histidine kinase